MKNLIVALILMMIPALSGCGGGGQEAPIEDTAEQTASAELPAEVAGGDDVLEIPVIPKGTTQSFWLSVRAGAMAAAEELGVKAIWQGPEREDDREMQLQVVQNFISRGADAIVLAPLDEVALVRPVETAVKRGIPVVIIDSDLKSDLQSSFVATDNREGGRLGARRLAEVLDGKGKVVVLRYAVGSGSTTNREEGFLEEIANYPDIEIISENQYAGVTKETALQASQSLLNRFENVDGIFCPNQSSAYGMYRALEIAGRAGKVKFVGFDVSQELLEGLERGLIDGLVSQDPFDMGYRGVKTAVAVVRGEEVEKRIPTRLVMVTPENVDDEEVREVINPQIGQ